MADQVNGQAITNVVTENDFGPEIGTSANSPYDCCVAAFTIPSGNPTIWAFYAQNGNDNCFIETEDSCPTVHV
ncbi:hypothetical protein PRZ48_014775 [Zasmidium cellare]|uniref:Uncharacterized protein n=1 Tax=Zasmidium cellare TaxID=395010 RepID=A0ABR0DZB1_ZASCE|nr:hypothetical protein PRZ48_014775 [Zasmidium cellare]